MDKRRILIVDDLEMNRNMLKIEFADSYDVKEATNGEEALKVLDRYSVDLIITDIFMDEMDGYELIRQVRKRKDTKKIPIIAITENDKASHERAILAGADDFLSRPFYKESVRELIEKSLARRENNFELINMEYVLNTIPGGVIVYKLKEHESEMRYVSQGIADLFGITLDEFYALERKVPYSGVYESDTERVMTALEQSRVTGEDIDINYRIYYRHEKIVWIRMQGRIVGEEDGYPLLHAIFLNESKETELYTNILDETNVVVFVIDTKTNEILYSNRIAKDWKEDISLQFESSNLEETDEEQFRVREFENNQRNYRLVSKKINWNGREACVQYIEDITKDKQNQMYAEDAKESLQKILTNLSVGVIVYQFYEKGKARIVEISPLMCQMLGTTSEKVIGLEEDDIFSQTHEEDIPKLKKAQKKLSKPGTEVMEIYRNRNLLTGEFKWFYMRGKSVKEPNDSVMAYISYSDITGQMELDEKLSESEQSLKAAIENNNLFYWEVDLTTAIAKCDDRLCNLFGIAKVGKNYPENFLKSKFIFNEDKELYRNKVTAAMSKCENTFFECRYMNPKTGKYDWCRINLTILIDKNGKPIRMLGTSSDISFEKETEKRYLEEVEYQKGIITNLLASCRVNLTQNKVDDFWIGEQKVDASEIDDQSDYRSRVSCILKDLNFSEQDNKDLSRTELLIKYMDGTKTIEKTFLAKRRSDDSLCWTRTEVKLLTSPVSGDVLAFFYTRDVSTEMMSRMTANMVANNSYEMTGYIVLSNRRFHLEEYNWNQNETKVNYYDYDLALEKIVEKRVPKDEQKEVLNAQNLNNIIGKLEEQKAYTNQYRYIDDDGEKRIKETQFFYGEESKEFVIVCRRDITDIMADAEKKHEVIQQALEDAQKANKAKSDFLSRMSHDMRTPMNAIIGLTTLMLDEEEVSDKVRDALDKIRTSSDFLLGLVNDVLDMAKIEEGSVDLHKEEYDYEEFIDSFISMFEAQCNEKGVHLQISRPKKGYVIYGDKLRINQIFFNIMSNAVKFTPKGGTVSYRTENLFIAKNKLNCDFVIEDNGVGMSEEFQKHMFEPFVQEDYSITTNYQGSGLGLSIAKSLTERMGGTLIIESALKKGTKVTIHMSFDIKGESKRNTEQERIEDVKNLQDTNRNATLLGKRILLVEDHPLNAEIAKRLLEKKQIIVEHVVNGQEAVNTFQKSKEGYYDAILMDIRMPVMDGIESTKHIRQMKRLDATRIPIIAMTANAYDEDMRKTREAGMNAHLSKPVAPQVLFDTLEKYLKE